MWNNNEEIFGEFALLFYREKGIPFIHCNFVSGVESPFARRRHDYVPYLLPHKATLPFGFEQVHIIHRLIAILHDLP